MSAERFPRVVCHRGANKVAPENTLAAARAAFDAGFSYVEIDVRVTKDGVPVVIHDSTLGRTTGTGGAVCDMLFEDMRRLSAGRWFSEHFTDEKIPTLDEMLALSASVGGNLYIEMKKVPPALVWPRVVEHSMENCCIFWSYCAPLIHELREIAPNAPIIARRQDFNSVEHVLKCMSPAIVEFTMSEDWSEFAALLEGGVSPMIFYAGNDRQEMSRIVRARPDFVNLDHPFLFAEICHELGLRHDEWPTEKECRFP